MKTGRPSQGGTCNAVASELVHVERIIHGARGTSDRHIALSAASGIVALRPSAASGSTYVSSWPMEVRVTPTSPGQSVTLCGDHGKAAT